jgi:hypothetical protein
MFSRANAKSKEHLCPDFNPIWNHARLQVVETSSGGLYRMPGSSNSALAQQRGGDKVKEDEGKRYQPDGQLRKGRTVRSVTPHHLADA